MISNETSAHCSASPHPVFGVFPPLHRLAFSSSPPQRRGVEERRSDESRHQRWENWIETWTRGSPLKRRSCEAAPDCKTLQALPSQFPFVCYRCLRSRPRYYYCLYCDGGEDCGGGGGDGRCRCYCDGGCCVVLLEYYLMVVVAVVQEVVSGGDGGDRMLEVVLVVAT